MTTNMYTMPPTPRAPRASPAFETARQGTLRIAEMSRTAQKWTTVGVPKAPTSGLRIERASAPRTTTTNCRPVSAAAEERSEEHTSELQSHSDLVCRLLLEKKKRPDSNAPLGLDPCIQFFCRTRSCGARRGLPRKDLRRPAIPERATHPYGRTARTQLRRLA